MSAANSRISVVAVGLLCLAILHQPCCARHTDSGSGQMRRLLQNDIVTNVTVADTASAALTDGIEEFFSGGALTAPGEVANKTSEAATSAFLVCQTDEGCAESIGTDVYQGYYRALTNTSNPRIISFPYATKGLEEANITSLVTTALSSASDEPESSIVETLSEALEPALDDVINQF